MPSLRLGRAVRARQVPLLRPAPSPAEPPYSSVALEPGLVASRRRLARPERRARPEWRTPASRLRRALHGPPAPSSMPESSPSWRGHFQPADPALHPLPRLRRLLLCNRAAADQPGLGVCRHARSHHMERSGLPGSDAVVVPAVPSRSARMRVVRFFETRNRGGCSALARAAVSRSRSRSSGSGTSSPRFWRYSPSLSSLTRTRRAQDHRREPGGDRNRSSSAGHGIGRLGAGGYLSRGTVAGLLVPISFLCGAVALVGWRAWHLEAASRLRDLWLDLGAFCLVLSFQRCSWSRRTSPRAPWTISSRAF